MSDRPIPLLGDISLDSVQEIRHDLDAGFTATPIAGLAGDLQQRTNRRSHRIVVAGMLFGDSSADQLKSLQEAAGKGEELTFSADISSALDLQKVVITEFTAVQVSGEPGRYRYRVALAESLRCRRPRRSAGPAGWVISDWATWASTPASWAISRTWPGKWRAPSTRRSTW